MHWTWPFFAELKVNIPPPLAFEIVLQNLQSACPTSYGSLIALKYDLRDYSENSRKMNHLKNCIRLKQKFEKKENSRFF